MINIIARCSIGAKNCEEIDEQASLYIVFELRAFYLTCEDVIES